VHWTIIGRSRQVWTLAVLVFRDAVIYVNNTLFSRGLITAVRRYDQDVNYSRCSSNILELRLFYVFCDFCFAVTTLLRLPWEHNNKCKNNCPVLAHFFLNNVLSSTGK